MSSAAGDDERFMRLALEQARRAGERGDRPIGCVIVHEGHVVARAGNRVMTTGCELDHAEMLAIRDGAAHLAHVAGACVLYTTLEPCVMCLGAIAESGIGQVVFGEADPRRGGDDTHRHVTFVADRVEDYRGGVLAATCARLRRPIPASR